MLAQILLLVCLVAAESTNWPSDTQWEVLVQTDSAADGLDRGRNFVGRPDAAALYYFNDGERFFVRMRLNDSPLNIPPTEIAQRAARPPPAKMGFKGTSGLGVQAPVFFDNNWGLLLDTDEDPHTWEAVIWLTGSSRGQSEASHSGQRGYLALSRNSHVDSLPDDDDDDAEADAQAGDHKVRKQLREAHPELADKPDEFPIRVSRICFPGERSIECLGSPETVRVVLACDADPAAPATASTGDDDSGAAASPAECFKSRGDKADNDYFLDFWVPSDWLAVVAPAYTKIAAVHAAACVGSEHRFDIDCVGAVASAPFAKTAFGAAIPISRK